MQSGRVRERGARASCSVEGTGRTCYFSTALTTVNYTAEQITLYSAFISRGFPLCPGADGGSRALAQITALSLSLEDT